MKAIIGLGNPGKEYENTRHNVGFLVLDKLAKRYEGKFKSKRSLEAEMTEVMIDDERILLVKPQTFMNASGRVLTAVLSTFPVKLEDVVVVYDDADLPFGDVRSKENGSSAGHRGMESILSALPKGSSLSRVRVGIGRPTHPDIPLDEFVLGRWTEMEEKALPATINSAIEKVLESLGRG
ncbi:aminoacyl-tRNA hydrolase [Patescibacteria group bacterium]|nr:MAG: aminoacyl-tRNA hydrolase [Patescibacteria group bacterium]